MLDGRSLAEGSAPDGVVQLEITDATTVEVPWAKFVEHLNEFLIEKIGPSVSEDRLVGPWFLSPAELGGALPGKLLIYLWDDLLRHHGRDCLFRAGIATYGALAAAGKAGKPVFVSEFLDFFSCNQESDE